jgi:predicted nucleic acid-binding protein
MELLSYPSLATSEEKQIRIFLSAVSVIDLRADVKDRAIELRRKYGLKLPDAIIAASALVGEAELITHDRKMGRVPGLRVYAPTLKDEGKTH